MIRISDYNYCSENFREHVCEYIFVLSQRVFLRKKYEHLCSNEKVWINYDYLVQKINGWLSAHFFIELYWIITQFFIVLKVKLQHSIGGSSLITRKSAHAKCTHVLTCGKTHVARISAHVDALGHPFSLSISKNLPVQTSKGKTYFCS